MLRGPSRTLLRTAVGAGVAVAILTVAGCETDRGGELLAPLLFNEADVPEARLYEPTNNTPEGAVRIPDDGVLRQSAFHLISDIDYYVFDAALGAPYTIETDGLGPGVDTRMALLNHLGNTLLNNDYAQDNDRRSRIVWTPTSSGTYHVVVQTSGGEPGGYGLRISTGKDAFEPDNVLSEASSIDADGFPQTRTLHSTDDVDVARFRIYAGLVYEVDATCYASYGLSTGSETSRHEASILEEDGTVLVPGDGSHPSQLAADVDGFAMVRVNSGYALGTYNLVVTIASDSYEPDDLISGASPITVGSEQRHALSSGDVDVVSFIPSAGETYVIATDSLGEGVDTRIELLTPQGVALESDDDGGENGGSRIVWSSTGTEERLVRITSSDGGRSGSYVVRVSVGG